MNPMRLASLLIVLLGCGARSTLEDDGSDGGGGAPEPAPSSPPNACVVACSEASPVGSEVFMGTSHTCTCHDCSAQCTPETCDDELLPAGECLACVQTALFGNECQNHAGLLGTCFEMNSECGAFTQCLLACVP
jgi:hypothetical protein